MTLFFTNMTKRSFIVSIYYNSNYKDVGDVLTSMFIKGISLN